MGQEHVHPQEVNLSTQFSSVPMQLESVVQGGTHRHHQHAEHLAIVDLCFSEVHNDREKLTALTTRFQLIQEICHLSKGNSAANEQRREEGRPEIHAGIKYCQSFSDLAKILLQTGADAIAVLYQDDIERIKTIKDPHARFDAMVNSMQGYLNFVLPPGTIELDKKDDYFDRMEDHKDPSVDASHVAYVDTAAILPGDCRGVYYALHAAMVENMREEGIIKAYGICRVDNAAAMRSHERCGYKIVCDKEGKPVIETFKCKNFESGELEEQPHYILELDVNSPMQTSLIEQAKAEGLDDIDWGEVAQELVNRASPL